MPESQLGTVSLKGPARRRIGAIPTAALLCALAVLAVALPASPSAAEPVISSVRVGHHSAMTRFVLTLSTPIKYRVFTLANPYRVVVDMPKVEWRLPSETKLRDGGPIMAFRFGAFTAETTRVVLDIRRPVKISKAFALEPTGKNKAWRLVVDIQPISKDQFDRLMKERRAASPRRSTPAALVEKPKRRKGEKPLIVLDPGHGGVDTGAISPKGTREKDIVLRFAAALKETLIKSGRYRVTLTRKKDVYIKLRQRYEIARKAGADLFMSIHADSNPSRQASGLSVYTLSERSSDKEAAALARRENRSDIIAGVDLNGETDQVAGILIDLAQRETMNMSARFAEILVRDLRRTTKLLPRTHRYAGFAVLKAPDVPSVLIELGYLTNRADERALTSKLHHDRVAGSMLRAIDRYFAYVARLARRGGPKQ